MKIILGLIFFISFSCLAASNNQSSQSDKDFYEEYLKKVEPWAKERDVVQDCHDIKRLSKFLSQASKWNSSAEVSSSYSELIENLIFENTTCLLDAVNLMNSKDMKYIMYYHITSPLYNSEIEVENKIMPHKEKYKALFSVYNKVKNAKNR